MPDIINGRQLPFYVQRSPRGSVVVCRAHFLTNEIKDEEAEAIVASLNAEHMKRMAP